MQHNADLAAVVSTGGASGNAPNIDNEVVQEMDEEDLPSDVNSSQKMEPRNDSGQQ